jgi:hypothetical protein
VRALAWSGPGVLRGTFPCQPTAQGRSFGAVWLGTVILTGRRMEGVKRIGTVNLTSELARWIPHKDKGIVTFTESLKKTFPGISPLQEAEVTHGGVCWLQDPGGI